MNRCCNRYGSQRLHVNVRRGVWVALVLALCIAIPSAKADALRLLALGDSLTAGYGLPQADGFTAQLERALADEGLEVKVINGGVSGDTTAGGRARLAWLLGDSPEDRPHAAIVELGANDALRGLDPANAYDNLDAILTELKNNGVSVLLAGMLSPPNLGQEYVTEFNALYPRLADKHGVLLYPFFLESVAGDRSLNQADGMHPSAEGVAEIVERILPAVKQLLRKTP
ncbi:MAG: arylesterase [Rhodospirillales bacterium]|nr:arylesterase [Rhodospirillales bacterium]